MAGVKAESGHNLLGAEHVSCNPRERSRCETKPFLVRESWSDEFLEKIEISII